MKAPCLALCWGIVLGAVPAGAHAETKVAVLPLQAKTGVDDKTAELLTDVITTEVAKRVDLRVIGTSEIKSMVSFEQQRSLLACTDDSCLAEIGAALGVDDMVTGSVGKLGTATILNLSLVDIRNAKVLGRVSEQVQGDAQALLMLLPHVVGTLMQAIPGGPPPPPRPAPPAGGQTATASDGGGQSSTPTKEEDGSGSSWPRRVGGLGVVGVGALLLAGAVGLGIGSLVLFGGSRFAHASLVAQGLPEPLIKFWGFAPALLADVGGIVSVVVIGVGIVIAVLP
ncbi:MAG: hypothetical protein AB2A00_06280 [Myxococcota bacterium]